MNCRILSLAQEAEWAACASALPSADVYHLPGYHRAYEQNGDGQALAFCAESDGQALLHPFLLRPIEQVAGLACPEGWQDLSSVYGYSGPLTQHAEPCFRRAAWSWFHDWAAANRAVCQFVRFNPLTQNQASVSEACQVCFDRETVVIDLEGAEAELWQRYPSVQRNMVRKALARGVTVVEVKPAEHLADFRRLYVQTMRRLEASRYYEFSDAYFEQLLRHCADQLLLLLARLGEEWVAAAMFLHHGSRLHYHLAGSAPERRDAAAGNLLVHAAALWGQRHGCRQFHLGGGRTSAPNDPLFQFKASFSKQRSRFHTGREVFLPEAYGQLCSTWIERRRPPTRPPVFQLYRLE